MKKYLYIIFILPITLFLVSCIDLGSFFGGKDSDGNFETDYYDYFSEVRYYKNYLPTTLDMNNFFNADTFEDKDLEETAYFKKEDRDYFQILVIPVEKDLTIGEFYLYLDTEESAVLDIDFYVTSNLIEVKTEEVTKEDGTTYEKKTFSFGDASKNELKISSKTYLDGYQIRFLNSEARKVSEDDKLILVFKDNIEENNIKLRFSNILISKEN